MCDCCNEERDMITLIGEEGEELNCEVVGSIEYEEAQYIIVVPEGQEGEEEAECLVLKQGEDEDEWVTVEDSEEAQAVLDLFQEDFDKEE